MALPNAGKTWQFDLSANKAGVVVRLDLAETYDTQTGQHVLTITGLQAKGTKGVSWYNFSYFLDGSISVNGQPVITFTRSSKDYYFYWGPSWRFEPVDAQYSGPLPNPLTWETSPVLGASATLTVDIRGYTASGQYGSGWAVSETVELDLTHIDVPDPGTGSVRSDLCIGFFYNGQRIFMPRYAGKPIGAFIKPVVIDPTEAILGTGILGKMILGKGIQK